MSSVFSSIGSAFSQNPLQSILGGAGAVSNFLGARQKNKYLQSQINYQKYLQSLAQDPTKMNAYVNQFEKPLDAGLVANVNNQVQAFGAERGLSTSPQIMSEIEAQALGPLQQQEQQMGINEAMASLGLPSGDPSALLSQSGPMDLTSIMKNLLQPGGAQSTVVPFNAPSGSVIPAPDDSPLPGSGSLDPGGADTSGIDINALIGLLTGGGGAPQLQGA